MTLWLIFTASVVLLMGLDLGIFHRRSREIRFAEALRWSAVWLAAALLFMGVLRLWRGPEAAVSFLTGYVVEWSLSADNVFVFLMIFAYFRVPASSQHKVLFWGIVGAVVLRAVMIATGVVLIHSVRWIVYLFGAFLILTGLRMALGGEASVHPERNPVLRSMRRVLPVTGDYRGDRFFVREAGGWKVTPLLLVLVVIETTDVVFAVDSVPAVLAITTDPLVVYTSNVFAILGLRSLYFVVTGVLPLFRYLRHGLSLVLVFVGAKMALSEIVRIPTRIALGVVAGVLGTSVLLSFLMPGTGGDQASSSTRERG